MHDPTEQEQRDLLQQAISVTRCYFENQADEKSAHWPTVAGHLLTEIERRDQIDPRLYRLAQRDAIVKAILTAMEQGASHDEGMVQMIEALSDYGQRMRENLVKVLNNQASHTIYVKMDEADGGEL